MGGNQHHFHPFHSEEGRQDQLRFFNHWLKGIDSGIEDEAPVKLLIRTGGGRADYWRFEQEWPLARTEWTKFYLRLTKPVSRSGYACLAMAPSPTSRSVSYPASGLSKAAGTPSWSATPVGSIATQAGVSFETAPLSTDMEVTGPINLVLWVSSTTEDMDIFATLRNIDCDGNDVWEVGQQKQQVPVAKGWLRASHRRLDPTLSLPYRPYHMHDQRQLLQPNQKTQLQVEIWPTCMVFKKGHRIRLDIQPRDGVGSPPYTHYSADYNTGTNTIYTGGRSPSYLLLPIIPSAAPKQK